MKKELLKDNIIDALFGTNSFASSLLDDKKSIEKYLEAIDLYIEKDKNSSENAEKIKDKYEGLSKIIVDAMALKIYEASYRFLTDIQSPNEIVNTMKTIIDEARERKYDADLLKQIEKTLVKMALKNENRSSIKNLFDNLELCIESYKLYYKMTYINNNEVTFKSYENTATLSDGSEFHFIYKIDENNLPDILGIPKGRDLALTDEKKKFFAETINGSIVYPINEESSSKDVLIALLKNKDRIIKADGLIEENSEIKDLLPWENIMAKTSSFIRGNLFNRCFSIVPIANNTNSGNNYAAIMPAVFSEDMYDNDYNEEKIVSELKNTTQTNFINTEFNLYNQNDKESIWVPKSISMKNPEMIRQGSIKDGGAVVTEIANLNGIRKFSLYEQLLTHVHTAKNLDIDLSASDIVLDGEGYLLKKYGEEFDEKTNKVLKR